MGIYGSPLPVPSMSLRKQRTLHSVGDGLGDGRGTLGRGTRRNEKAIRRQGWWEASQSHHGASVRVHFRSLGHERGRRMDSLTGYRFPQIRLMVERGEEAEGLARLWRSRTRELQGGEEVGET